MMDGLFTQLHWKEPFWFLLLSLPLIIFLLQRIKRKNQLNQYADPDLQAWVIQSQRRRLFQYIVHRKTLFLIAWVLLSLAMAGPRIADELPGTEYGSGLDIMIMVDLSRSMKATDVQPDRIKRSSIELHEFLSLIKEPRIGMVLFAARPHLYFPLTSDKYVVEFYLKSLDDIILPTHGSNIVGALQMSISELSGSPMDDYKPGRIILLITDGDFDLNENSQIQLSKVLSDLKKNNISVYILGVGSIEGEAIPLADGSWLLDKGIATVSRMNDNTLKQMADQTGGQFHIVTDDASDWQSLYFDGMLQKQSHSVKLEMNDDVIWREYYPWLLFPGIILLFICTLPFRIDSKSFFNRAVQLFFMINLLLLSIHDNVANAETVEGVREAANIFKDGNYIQARDKYKINNGYAARFGEGASRYRLGDFTGAIRQFSQAALETSNAEERTIALYNLANSYYQTGNYQTAVEVYDDVLRYQSTNKASIKNRDVSLILIKQIEERIQLEKAARIGRGPGAASSEEGIVLNESSRVSISDEESNTVGALPDIEGVSATEFEELIQKGVKHVRLAASGANQTNDSKWNQLQFEARYQMLELIDNKAKHMQRLFEMEEGFAAPVEMPVSIPGVQPW